jgi:hypothetical protein
VTGSSSASASIRTDSRVSWSTHPVEREQVERLHPEPGRAPLQGGDQPLPEADRVAVGGVGVEPGHRPGRQGSHPLREQRRLPTSWSSGATTSASQHQRLQPGHDGLPHAQHRPHRQGGRRFTDYYGEQSCTAGRAAFITGQSPIRTGLTKVGMPGAEGMKGPDHRHLLKHQGYVHRPVRQEPPGRPRRVPADQPRLRRVLRQPLPPQRRGGARAPDYPKDPELPEEVRPARRDPQLRRRPHRPTPAR